MNKRGRSACHDTASLGQGSAASGCEWEWDARGEGTGSSLASFPPEHLKGTGGNPQAQGRKVKAEEVYHSMGFLKPLPTLPRKLLWIRGGWSGISSFWKFSVSTVGCSLFFIRAKFLTTDLLGHLHLQGCNNPEDANIQADAWIF